MQQDALSIIKGQGLPKEQRREIIHGSRGLIKELVCARKVQKTAMVATIVLTAISWSQSESLKDSLPQIKMNRQATMFVSLLAVSCGLTTFLAKGHESRVRSILSNIQQRGSRGFITLDQCRDQVRYITSGSLTIGT
jgi:hypothetical protein